MLKSWVITLGCHRVKKEIKSGSENKMLLEMQGEKKRNSVKEKRKKGHVEKEKKAGIVLWTCQRTVPGVESKFT